MKPYRRDFVRLEDYNKALKVHMRKELREYIDGIKSEKGCKDCGIKNPVVLQFHHRDGIGNGHYVGRLHAKYLVDREIAKCDILCANCHLIRHNTET